jgi:DNA-binding MarR family transcriptional regulator
LPIGKFAKCEIFDTFNSMWGNASPGAIAARFARLVEQLGGDTAAAKAMGQQRDLLAAVGAAEPATLNHVAARVKRGAPAISRAIDALVRAGLVDRQADPANRRRLALRLTDEGRRQLNRPPAADHSLEGRLAKLAASELRALERGIELLERLPQ